MDGKSISNNDLQIEASKPYLQAQNLFSTPATNSNMTSIFDVGPVFHSERGAYPFRLAPARIATPVLAFGDFFPFLLPSPPTEAPELLC
jgi:hypothetical protein